MSGPEVVLNYPMRRAPRLNGSISPCQRLVQQAWPDPLRRAREEPETRQNRARKVLFEKRFDNDRLCGGKFAGSRGQIGQNKSDFSAVWRPKPGDHTALNSRNPWQSRKIEGLPGAGQLQVASK